MPEMKLTNTSVSKIEIPAPIIKGGIKSTAQVIYRDTEVRGFGLRVTSGGAKTFIAEKWMDGKVFRVRICDVSQKTAESARDEAKKIIGSVISTKENPNEQRRIKKAKEVTLQQVFTDFLAARKNLSPRTIEDYKRIVEKVYFKDWLNKPISGISKDMVARKHSKLGESSPAQANYAMRVLRALYNFAISQYEVNGEPSITDNPVKRLSQTKSWFKETRRKTYINPQQFKSWFAAVNKLTSKSSADYLMLTILTGLRRSEGASIKWADVDFANKTFTLRDTKNHEDHTLPMSDFILDLFKRRLETKKNDYVFAGIGSARDTFLHNPNKAVAAVVRESSVDFTMHDLRRTFITVAESLDISAYAVKRLANHKMRNDVTAGYIVSDVERLRKPMQQITDFILSNAGVKKPDKVVKVAQKSRV